jgi:hypothetical protein
MANRQTRSVEPRGDGRRAVQREGARRAKSLHPRTAAAMARGLEPSTRHEVQLLIKGASGRIQRTYGNDPRRFPG